MMVSSELNTQCLHKGTDMKQRIREWQRKNEIHPLAFYESFSLDGIFDEIDSPYDSDVGEPLSSEPLSSEPLSSEPLSSEPLSSEPLSSEPLSHTMFINETQIGGLIVETPDLEDNSQRKPVTITRERACNINSKDIRNMMTRNRVASCQRKEVSSPAA